VLETGKIVLKKSWLSTAKMQLGLGAPDSVRCARLALANWLLSGLRRRRTTINHRTVRWCTGLSGGAPDCPVSQQSAGPTVGRGIRARRVASANGQMGHWTVRCANGSKGPTVGFAKEGKKSAPDSVRWCTGLSGAPGDRRQELPSWNALNGS
jgi:hypothetical protein